MGNPIAHFEIIGKDKKALSDFYSSVFEWKIDPVMDEYSLVNTGSGIGGGIGGMNEERRHVTFYVAVDDIVAKLAEIESKGGKTAFGPHPIPAGGFFAGFEDPEGHLIGLMQGPPVK